MLAPSRRSRDSPLRTYPVTQFGGLNLRDDPQDVGLGGAVDLLNVDLKQAGRLRTRDGSTRLGSSSVSGSVPSFIVPTSIAGTEQLVALSATNGVTYLDKFTTAGAKTAVGNWAAYYPIDAVRFGTPTAETLYVSSADASGIFGNAVAVTKYDGSTLTTVLGQPMFLARLPASNRLVQAHFALAAHSPTTANGSRSTVFFSDEGAPDTYSANNYVHLQPGDGEYIVGAVTWRDLLFVFKQSTLFVFYGSTTDATGATEFNYRTVSLPAPIELPSVSKRPITVGTDGVYFIADGAVYRTQGGGPAVVSDAVEPILKRSASSSLNYGGQQVSLSWLQERLFVRYLPESGSNPLVLVFDTRSGQWLLWQFGDDTNTGQRMACDFKSWQGKGYYVNSAGHVVFLDSAATVDDSVSFASRYRTGFSDLGNPEAEKLLREVLIDGYGSPTVKVAVNDGSLDAGSVVTLGTSPTVAQGRLRKGYRGRNVSLELSGSAPWGVSRLAPSVWDDRPPQEKSS